MKALRYLYDSAIGVVSLTLFAAACLLWSLIALPLLLVLPDRAGAVCGRWGILVGSRLYLLALRIMGAYRFDARVLHELRGGPPVVLAPNHPSLIDALFVIAHTPNVACVMKSSLMNNVLAQLKRNKFKNNLVKT